MNSILNKDNAGDIKKSWLKYMKLCIIYELMKKVAYHFEFFMLYFNL